MLDEAGWDAADLGGAGSLGWHGNAVVWRRGAGITLTELDHIALPGLEPRGAVAVDLDIGGEKIRVAAMHLSLLGHFRKKQISSLMHQLHENLDYLPTVLIGDLNEWRDTARSLKLLEERYALDVVTVDERLTSAEAESLLRAQRQSGARRRRLSKEDVDRTAAVLIAQSWLRHADSNEKNNGG